MQTPKQVVISNAFGSILTAGLLLALSEALGSAAPPPLPVADLGDANLQRERDFLEVRLQGSGPISSADYDRALERWRRLPKATSTSPKANLFAPAAVSGVNGVVWKPIGPSPIVQGANRVNGRVNSIALNPNNPNVIYQGSAGGGIWRSINGGTNWTPLTDQQSTLGTGKPTALAIDPNNTDTLYVGTSMESELGLNQIMNLSKGILKSTDGGASWVVLGSGFPSGNDGNADDVFAGNDVNSVLVDPANSSLLYLASNIGLFRSTDGGRNWTPGTGGGGNARSLVLDTTSPVGNRILYAGLSGTGVKQSTNGGQTWTSILTSATPVVNTALGTTGAVGQVIVALAPPLSPANPAGIQVLYVCVEMCGGGVQILPNPVPIFLSTDQGTNWTQVAAAGLSGGNVQTYCGFTLEMGVDPASPGDGVNDIIYWGALGQFKSSNSGATFSPIDAGHADTHAAWTFARQPSGPSIVFTGNDGGIWKSTDGGATFTGTGGSPTSINEGGLQTTLFYHLDLKRDASASVSLGALQDNGDITTTGIPVWTTRVGGDGIDVAYDNGSVAYGIGNTYLGRTMNDGVDNFGAALGGIPASEIKTFFNQINTDPGNTGVVYVSGSSNGLFQSIDSGATFRQIAGLGRPGPVDVAPANSNNVVVAIGSQVFVSVNAHAATVGPPSGVTFQNIPGLPGRSVTQVAFDPNDPAVIYATLSGFGGGHVFRSRVGATSWTDISPAIDIPFNALALDGASTPTTVYVGTDLGVLRSVDGGASWTTLDDIHFPNVPVTELKINALAHVLRAATFGRGVFELAASSGPVIAVNAQNGLDFGNACAGQPLNLTLQVFNVGTADLIIQSVRNLMGSSDFAVLPNPATPLVISPNAEVDFTVRYTPLTPGPQQALIRITSSDPGAPFFDLTATGTRTNATIVTAIADSGNFGDVCVGSFKDLGLTIHNAGGCPLRVTGISSSSSQFQTASVITFPLVVEPGDSIEVPIRFAPTSPGSKSGTIAVASNDPQVPSKVVSVSGNAPTGDIRVTGSTDFSDVCAGVLAEKTISICNVGRCNLNVTNVSLVAPCPDFTLVNNPFPAAVSHDFCVDVVIRFTPTSCGPKSCTLRIVSDDPDSPVINLTVMANALCPVIDVPPDLGFAPEVIQTVGDCKSLLPFPISNNGQCNLTITSIVIGGANAGDFGLAGLPSFPIILEPGHIVGEGDLAVVFAPTVVDRDREGTITVTYVSDPFSGATASVTRQLCGEGVYTGARVLVTQGGIPLVKVEKIHLQRINANRNKDRLDSQDQAMDLVLTTVTPSPPCEAFQYHREYGTVSNPIQLLPGSYQVTVSAIINGKHKSKSVGFDLSTCDFNPSVVVDF